MNEMRNIAICFVAVSLFGCTSLRRPSAQPTYPVQLKLLEAYALDIIRSKETHVILEFWDSDTNLMKHGADFAHSLRKKGYQIVASSSVRCPKASEKDPSDPERFRGLEVKRSGVRVVSYRFRVVKALDDNRFIVHWSMYGGPLYGGGSECEIEFMDGKIVVKKHIRSSTS